MMLRIRDLSIRIGRHNLVSIGELQLSRGKRLGLVGESGAGKSMTAMSIVGLAPPVAQVSGSIQLGGRELLGRSARDQARVRGSEIGVIFQDPLQALNPMMRVGRQVAEAIRLHGNPGRQELRQRLLHLLHQVKLSQPEQLAHRYPHQLSGGQRQRILIAIAIARSPKLLIADEPTTALDVTVQQGILELLVELSTEQNMSLLFVSHDLGVVRAVTQDIAVMYGGRLMEVGPADQVISQPRHRYTEALVAANPGWVAPSSIQDLIGQPLNTIRGTVPSLGGFPSGCRFRDRCGHATAECSEGPATGEDVVGHRYWCWNPTEAEEVSAHVRSR